jgi:hypothetical protein
MEAAQNVNTISDSILEKYPHINKRIDTLLSYFPGALIHVLEPKNNDNLLIRLDRDTNSANTAKNERESVVKITGSDRKDAINFALIECLGPLRIHAARSWVKPSLYVNTEEPILAVEWQYTDTVIQKIISQSIDHSSPMVMQPVLWSNNEEIATQIDKMSRLMEETIHPHKIFAERGNLFTRPNIDELYKSWSTRDDILEVWITPDEMLNHYRALYIYPNAKIFPIYHQKDVITSQLVIDMQQALAVK